MTKKMFHTSIATEWVQSPGLVCPHSGSRPCSGRLM